MNDIINETINKIKNRKPTDFDYDIETAFDKIALQIIMYMVTNNLNTIQMAEKCDVTPTTLSNIIKLNHYPNLYSLIKIFQAMGFELVPIKRSIK